MVGMGNEIIHREPTSPIDCIFILQAFPYPPSTGFNRYLIRYKLPGDTSERAQYVNTGNRFTIRRGLKVNITVNFTVAAQYKITYCNQFILGDRSEVVSATTQETGEWSQRGQWKKKK